MVKNKVKHYHKKHYQEKCIVLFGIANYKLKQRGTFEKYSYNNYGVLEQLYVLHKMLYMPHTGPVKPGIMYNINGRTTQSLQIHNQKHTTPQQKKANKGEMSEMST